MEAKVIHIDEPKNICANCGIQTRFLDDEFCSDECFWEATTPKKPATRRMAAIIKIDKNGDESFHD